MSVSYYEIERRIEQKWINCKQGDEIVFLGCRMWSRIRLQPLLQEGEPINDRKITSKEKNGHYQENIQILWIEKIWMMAETICDEWSNRLLINLHVY